MIGLSFLLFIGWTGAWKLLDYKEGAGIGARFWLLLTGLEIWGIGLDLASFKY